MNDLARWPFPGYGMWKYLLANLGGLKSALGVEKRFLDRSHMANLLLAQGVP